MGACGSCGMRAFADENGTLYVLYRAATEQIRRDTVLLVSRDHGKHFVADRVAKWDLDACPMTTNFISQAGRKVLIAMGNCWPSLLCRCRARHGRSVRAGCRAGSRI